MTPWSFKTHFNLKKYTLFCIHKFSITIFQWPDTYPLYFLMEMFEVNINITSIWQFFKEQKVTGKHNSYFINLSMTITLSKWVIAYVFRFE